jgi:manganese efflux pump family protein
VVAKLIALVLPLGFDTFAISAALGAFGAGRRHRWRVSLLFTAFEAGMPLIGRALGTPLGHAIGRRADYLAIGLLVVLGLYILLVGAESDERLRQLNQLRGAGAALLGISVSLDELAIGFTIGLLRLPAGLVIAAIAVQAFVVAQLGFRLGRRFNAAQRENAERMAGVMLAGLGLVLLAEKLLG